MRIAICGSVRFYEKIKTLRDTLESQSHDVAIPADTSTTDFDSMSFEKYTEAEHQLMNDYIDVIKSVDAILIANYDTPDKPNYIGMATFLEMSFAYVLQKKIFVLQSLPSTQVNALEIAAFYPTYLKGDIGKITL